VWFPRWGTKVIIFSQMTFASLTHPTSFTTNESTIPGYSHYAFKQNDWYRTETSI
jgi:hypothetical protein